MYVGYLWKALGTVAKVYFGQVTMSIHTKLKNKEHMIETLLKTKFKFPGCQRIYISNKNASAVFHGRLLQRSISFLPLTIFLELCLLTQKACRGKEEGEEQDREEWELCSPMLYV
ncbi:unnamed protein product [Rangifer tarandus platyrhynchus]|uniref:Uncharacterized protein n=1 Tax=Rangifer tarandus platyrhynchus TaxID=3082113 RepID=A0AC59ZWA2_RANTA